MKKIFTLGLLVLSVSAQAASSGSEVKLDFPVSSSIDKISFYQNGKLTYGKNGEVVPVKGPNCTIMGAANFPAGTSFTAVLGNYANEVTMKHPKMSEDKKSASLLLYPTDIVRNALIPADVYTRVAGITIDCEGSKNMSTEDFLNLVKQSFGGHLVAAPNKLPNGLVKWQARGKNAFERRFDQALLKEQDHLISEESKRSKNQSKPGDDGIGPAQKQDEAAQVGATLTQK
jgi:hypothetical protein